MEISLLAGKPAPLEILANVKDPSRYRACHSHGRRTDDCALGFAFMRENFYTLNLNHK